MKRIYSVLELHLSRTGKPYLVGDKCSFADLMFVPNNKVFEGNPDTEFKTKEWEEKYPLSYAWNQRLFARESVKEAIRIGDETALPH
jgi:glutathione S-transferase